MNDSIRDINDELLNAVKNSEIDKVKSLISEGADVNAYDGSQGNSLYWAVKNNHSDIAKVLLDNGADFIAYDSSRERNVLNKYEEVKAEHCKVSLHLAARLGDLKAVEDLLKKEANVNTKNDKGQTPLDLAKTEEIKNLLQSIKDANDKLLEAAKSGNIDDVENLLNEEGKAQVNAKNELEETPLHLAAENGHKYVVRFLFSKGAKVDAKSDDLSTPLHLAAKYGHKDIVEFLFSKGANVDAQDEYGNTPLHLAVENEHVEIVETLLSRADVNAQNNQGKTPLHLTIQKIDLDITDIFYTILNKKGINVNLTDNNKDTPLHLFFKKNVMDIDALRYLLDAESINVNLQNIDGNTPLHLVIQKSNWNTLPPYSVCNRKLVVDTLIKMGANVDAVNEYEKTPLHLASSDGHTEIAKALINAEANVDAVGKHEMTPLHWAAKYGRKEIVEALINAEANVDAQDKYGNTPFDLASTEEIKALLLKAIEKADDSSASTDNEVGQEEDVGQESNAQSAIQEQEEESQEINAEEGNDVKIEAADNGHPTDKALNMPKQNSVSPQSESSISEEQPSSFFGNLFSILMKPFSLIGSFFGGFFSWLFGSDEPSTEPEQPTVLDYQEGVKNSDDII